jgi:serine/threonine protein phosphatase 1
MTDIVRLFRDRLSTPDAMRSHSPNTIVFLGDYIDRGPKSREVVELLMAGPKRDGDKWICLRGNHEQMMVDTYRKPLEPDWWLRNGGEATEKSFGGRVPDAVIDWCAALPTSHETTTHFFVHAGIRPGLALHLQDEEAMMWIRDKFLDDERDHGKHIVHGHTPKRTAELLPNRTNLDSGAVFYGTLTAARFDGPGSPASLFTVTP